MNAGTQTCFLHDSNTCLGGWVPPPHARELHENRNNERQWKSRRDTNTQTKTRTLTNAVQSSGLQEIEHDVARLQRQAFGVHEKKGLGFRWARIEQNDCEHITIHFNCVCVSAGSFEVIC